MFEYFWDSELVGWVPWVKLVPEYVHRPELQFNQILVPTVDTVRTTWILNILLNRQCPVCTLTFTASLSLSLSLSLPDCGREMHL